MVQDSEIPFRLLSIGNDRYGTMELVVSLRQERNILYKLVCHGPEGYNFEIFPTLEELMNLGTKLISVHDLAKNKSVLDKGTFEHLKFLFQNIFRL